MKFPVYQRLLESMCVMILTSRLVFGFNRDGRLENQIDVPVGEIRNILDTVPECCSRSACVPVVQVPFSEMDSVALVFRDDRRLVFKKETVLSREDIQIDKEFLDEGIDSTYSVYRYKYVYHPYGGYGISLDLKGSYDISAKELHTYRITDSLYHFAVSF